MEEKNDLQISKKQQKRKERKRLKAIEISKRAQQLKLHQLALEEGECCKGDGGEGGGGGKGKAARARAVRQGDQDIGNKEGHRAAGAAPLLSSATSPITKVIEEAESLARWKGIGKRTRADLVTDVHGSMVSQEEKDRQGKAWREASVSKLQEGCCC
jgi:hypothetical protein